MDIPIIIICYNNYRYVENTILQILKINKDYYKNIIILNNASTCVDTIKYLKNLADVQDIRYFRYLKNLADVQVINHIQNFGPWIWLDNNRHIYDLLPNKFILTDPDLKFNKNIPSDFIEILANLSDKYKTSKIGFALDISDHEKFYMTTDCMGISSNTLYISEKKYWDSKINDDNEYELYNAAIDTTFSLINKENVANGSTLNIRVAGNFTAKHIPWYIDNEIYNVYDNYYYNSNTTSISTFSNIIIANINNKYLSFWKDNYSSWNNEMFEIFDKYLSNDKIFIDIGGWNGATSIYCSRKSKHIYAIEADISAFNYMKTNLKANCANNYTLINKAIYNIDNAEMETITLETIIKNYNIDVSNISLIKVDIKGEEENILDTLYDIHIKYCIPLYISFHYNLWNDKNLDRFHYLSENNKNKIASLPICFILFIIRPLIMNNNDE